MIKFIGCLMIFFGCSSLGFKYASLLDKRVLQLKTLEKSIMILENEITYTYTEVPEAFLKIGQKTEGTIGRIFLKARENLINNTIDDVYFSVKNSVEENNKDLELKHKDLEILYDISKGLGQWDIQAHKNIFKLGRLNLQRQIEEAESLQKKQGKMFKTLGISLGGIICILIS